MFSRTGYLSTESMTMFWIQTGSHSELFGK